MMLDDTDAEMVTYIASNEPVRADTLLDKFGEDAERLRALVAGGVLEIDSRYRYCIGDSEPLYSETINHDNDDGS